MRNESGSHSSRSFALILATMLLCFAVLAAHSLLGVSAAGIVSADAHLDLPPAGSVPTIAGTIVGVDQPNGLAVHAPSSTLFVTSRSAGAVKVYDAATLLPKAPDIVLGGHPFGIAVSGDRVYVADFDLDSISVINAISDTVVGTISLCCGTQPSLFAVDPDGRVFVSLNGSGQVAVLNNGALDRFIDLGANTGPFGLAIDPNPASHFLYVGLRNSQRVVQENLDTYSENPRFSLPGIEAIPFMMA